MQLWQKAQKDLKKSQSCVALCLNLSPSVAVLPAAAVLDLKAHE